jgi:hexosaminidase
MMKLKHIAWVLGLFCLISLQAQPEAPAIIPAPQKMDLLPGAFTLKPTTEILVAPASLTTGQYLAERLRASTGYKIPVRAIRRTIPVPDDILLTTRWLKNGLDPESYQVLVQSNCVVIRSPEDAGLFYGAQTFLQLLPPEIFARQTVSGTPWEVPCVDIKDQPRFKWRGLMLDVSRHFFNKSEVEQLLDALALYKINTFHWHLVDDQGWRIEIKRYPGLVRTGAWRKGINFGLDPKSSKAYDADGRYGGFYTQADIREVVAYAAARHITIIPEIEMPGHSSAALSAYPELSCTGGPFTPDVNGGVFDGIYCVGNPQATKFVQDVLTEVFELFPGKYVHVGGDEVPTTNWAHCPKCQAVMKKEGFKKEIELESYFIRGMEKFINAHGRSLIGWSEIREGGLAQNAAIMDWIGGAVEAATAGHDVVMTPLSDCYLDHYQSKNQSAEPHAIGGFLPLKQVYSYEPIPTNLPSQFQPHILGAQGNVWTEYMPNISHVEYMIFPRLNALAEVNWSPRTARNWPDFKRRLAVDSRRLEQLGVNYRRLSIMETDSAQEGQP